MQQERALFSGIILKNHKKISGYRRPKTKPVSFVEKTGPLYKKIKFMILGTFRHLLTSSLQGTLFDVL